MKLATSSFTSGAHGGSLFIGVVKRPLEILMSSIPASVRSLLQEFADVIPPELPKVLPPCINIDHTIDMIPGAVPPKQPPYQMAPAELAELRKQLDELLESGYIQPSKAPY